MGRALMADFLEIPCCDGFTIAEVGWQYGDLAFSVGNSPIGSDGLSGQRLEPMVN